jgi:type II secretory pathway component PulF
MESTMERELAGAVHKELQNDYGNGNKLRVAMERAGSERTMSNMIAQPMVRMAEAVQRIQRIAEELERVADKAERQLKAVKDVIS